MRTQGICAAIAATALSSIHPAEAQNCRIHVDTGKCIFIPADQRVKPDFAVGDTFPVYEHSMLINLDRYKLPPVNGAWRYYKSGYDIYRVDANDYTVLEIIRNARSR
ncbi:hypothetical protein DEA8626_01193 [Defluviimonas aquaemixtae]|uniref:Nickel/cobalt homeostasis protein RcnB n=1 Tax=Albidovulum aquaemixtae TaxID=1542388 RepID=A0A2R8B4Z4_9RHOB|nr:hypothetical protein [Defluviimonas aquaemixtae]SPH17669.1 hypothetical protein DEA8626_01193 [Defluviimonas aquaemixtae]